MRAQDNEFHAIVNLIHVYLLYPSLNQISILLGVIFWTMQLQILHQTKQSFQFFPYQAQVAILLILLSICLNALSKQRLIRTFLTYAKKLNAFIDLESFLLNEHFFLENYSLISLFFCLVHFVAKLNAHTIRFEK